MSKKKSKKQDPAQLMLENEMKEKVDIQDNVADEEEKKQMAAVAKMNFMKRLGPYNKPCINIVIGLIGSCVHGTVNPVFGVLVTKMLFSLMIPDLEEMKTEAWKWALYMFICALIDLVAVFF